MTLNIHKKMKIYEVTNWNPLAQYGNNVTLYIVQYCFDIHCKKFVQPSLHSTSTYSLSQL